MIAAGASRGYDMPTCLIAIDQGTTSSRAIVFDTALTPLASAQQEFTQIFPAPGAQPYRRDLKDFAFHLLDAGHFALETTGAEIAGLMRAACSSR